MTGLEFPGIRCFFNVKKDLMTLGAKAAEFAPVTAYFCCGCSVDYMREFNRRNAERRTYHS
jgi:hypothetical protein